MSHGDDRLALDTLEAMPSTLNKRKTTQIKRTANGF